MGSVPPGRQCGPCSFCCKVMEIPELNKAAGTWCPHRSGEAGCGIHGSHPHVCQAFTCQWLLDASMPEDYRPDRTKVVLTAERKPHRLVAHCDINNPLAWQREPIYSLLKRQAANYWASDLNVIAKAGTRMWLITPTEELDMGNVSERTPFSIQKLPNGSAVVAIHPEVEAGEDVEARLAQIREGGGAELTSAHPGESRDP